MANAQPEPSMDEILASIRRIIAEDEPEQQADARSPDLSAELSSVAESEVTPPEPPAARTQRPAPEAVADTQFDDSGSFDSEDGFDAVFDQPETVAEQLQPAAAAKPEVRQQPAEPAPVQARQPEPQVSQPQQVREPEAAAPQIQPVLSNYNDALQAAVATPRIVRKPVPGNAEGGPAVQQTRVEEAFQPEQETADAADSVLSDTTVASSSTAFAALEENIRLSNASGDTLQDVVERMLEPMLRQWLDTNLSRIVEEKVEDEVRRISRRR
ncbi:DUF2497 domain-containing protein [Parvularcula sp. IMCC14364]|uniref:DUF2497 domain-containing protein n=1 Tax=Parvularcula sp. IMCC14364 TaxID=3067902 RepID=UPI002740F4E7|nr:DUF2497 domain-containing protein [Parvularcula sp. IMCC14364]